MNVSLFDFGIKHIEFLAIEYFKADYKVHTNQIDGDPQFVQFLFKKLKSTMEEVAPLTDGGLTALEIMVNQIRDTVLYNEMVKTCDRCNGRGVITKYSHINNGICFKCQGKKTVGAKR